MITTILDEVVNGWVLTVFSPDGQQKFIYERYIDAAEHRGQIELKHVHFMLKGGTHAN